MPTCTNNINWKGKNVEFKDRLKKLRIKQSLTQAELSYKTGISNGMIGLLEVGERNPSKKTLKKLAAFFNVTVDFLETGKEKNTYIIQDFLQNLVDNGIIKDTVLDQETRDIIIKAVELELEVMLKNKKRNR